MRLIDADALMQAMYHRAFETDGDTMWQSGCWVRYRAIEQTVKEQPTIEPERKPGKWNGYNADNPDWLRDDGSPVFLTCSECHGTVINNGSAHWDFCPNCGADMRGEQDDESRSKSNAQTDTRARGMGTTDKSSGI